MTPELEARYAEPHRHYHTRRHIEQCLQFLDLVPDLTDGERRTLTWAIWWHDAIYDPEAPDNEARSAELAKQDLKALDATLHERDEVARLIRLTAGHARGTCSMARSQNPNSANSQFFICFDDAAFLNRQYTVWGQVIEGMDNVDKIKRGEPVQDPDKIVSLKVAADV